MILYCFSDDEKKNQDWPCKAERGVTNIMFNELMTLLQGQIFQVAQKLHPSHLLGKSYADQLRFHPENRQCFLLENLSSHRGKCMQFSSRRSTTICPTSSEIRKKKPSRKRSHLKVLRKKMKILSQN